jgi:outer membrane protein OmpA-like peptidoglycan-associated protein
MRKVFVTFAAVFLASCAGGRETYGPPPAPPSRAEYPPPAKAKPEMPPSQRTAEQPEPRRVPQNVPSAGPLKTAMVGSYMDNQERDLRQHLRGVGVLVSRPGDEIVLNIRDDSLFEGGTNKLSGSGRNALATIAIIARHYDHTQVSVGGFTDTTGTPEQNMSASQRRAKAVADALIADGVNGDRISSEGFGETHLKVKTGDHVNEPRNRRIEIRISAQATG